MPRRSPPLVVGEHERRLAGTHAAHARSAWDPRARQGGARVHRAGKGEGKSKSGRHS